MEEKGQNYLIPTSYKDEDALDLEYSALRVATVLEALDKAACNLSLVFLDACRSSALPARSLAGATRSLGRGLAKVEAPTGMLISFACAPGSTASDGDGRNGVYTANLLEHLPRGEDVQKVLGYVVSGVQKSTNGAQVPWMSGALARDPSRNCGDIYLIEPHIQGPAPAHAAPAPRTASLKEAAAAGADVAGLTQWLACIGLANREASIIPKLVGAGVLNVEELEELEDESVKELDLPIFERQKLANALKTLAGQRNKEGSGAGEVADALASMHVDMANMNAAIKRVEATGAATSSAGGTEAVAQARETMLRADQAVKAGDVLRRALATKDYDKILAAVETAEALDIRIPELDQARAFMKTLEAAPLPAAVATGTMSQILDIARGARWRFEKFGGLRPQERFAKGRLMLASTKKKVQDGMLSYTKEVIPRSMLDMDAVLAKQAVGCHKCLLEFCGDRKTSYPAAAGHHVLETGAKMAEMRDEIYVQLCKHLTGNSDPRSSLRGWILMCLCVDLFVPSVKFELYLLNFLGSASNDTAHGEYARYCIARLEEALVRFRPNVRSLRYH